MPIGDDSYHCVFKPTFPSNLTINEIISVIKAPSNNQKAKTFPNAFIAYKKALIKENRIRNIKLPPMGKLSKIASYYWDEEPEIVKKFYKKLSEDAKSLYKQNGIQIIFDKRMNEVEESGQVGQVSRVTSEIRSDSDYVNYTQRIEVPVEYIIKTQNSTSGYFPVEDYSASVMNSFLGSNPNNSSQDSFPNSNFFEDAYRINEVNINQKDNRFFTPANHVNTQGIDVPAEYIINTQNSTSGYLPIEDCVMNPFLNRNPINSCFPNSSFFEDTYRMNKAPIDQEDVGLFTPPRVANHVNYTQGIEGTNFTPNTYLPFEDYSTCNPFEEYGMEHNFNDFVLVENNQEIVQVSPCDAKTNCINYGTVGVLPVENIITNL
ncbi:8579_t:CDS:1 [Funneliformis geosporum]|uniref:3309_t:CDS:1 n=1 Tax=Funneliformis geosporum TaxID=1117311 RepID=A0A9W4SAE2_9GLOM|nr:3309_t:CDS:1 [Funneliformis geosporum]CAI2165287.1 8579_t:CDS:1 [Funneliformis geosporum]